MDTTLLKREILYRGRRSMAEMDKLIQPFLAAKLNSLTEAQMLSLRDMLHEMDQNLLASWRGEKPVPAEYAEVFAVLRQFHAEHPCQSATLGGLK
ncbi:MAG: succinate dehydrogenase assembly factor 2 [Alphaproteobacteria bacterium]